MHVPGGHQHDSAKHNVCTRKHVRWEYKSKCEGMDL